MPHIAIDPLAVFPDVPDSAKYGDRELSQLMFNARVLAMAADPHIPLFERLKYVAIYSGNTDEWVQKRLFRLDGDDESLLDAPEWLPGDQRVELVRTILRDGAALQSQLYRDVLLPQLADNGIHIVEYNALNHEQRAEAQAYFVERMFPLFTPLAIDPGRPFPHISTLSHNIAVELEPRPGERARARVKIPSSLPRFVPITSIPEEVEEVVDNIFVPTEQVIIAHLDRLFPNVPVVRATEFRVTRHSAGEWAEASSRDLLETIESGLQKRRFERVVRIEIPDSAPEDLITEFGEDLGNEEALVVSTPGPLDLTGLWQIVGLKRKDLSYREWHPRRPRAMAGDDMWARMRANDLIVHHPYEDFDLSTLAFIQAAATDPKVVAIKLTIYRTATENSPIIRALIQAAEAGKQVVALVELKARFDEQANIRRARDLEAAGVHVVYGLIGLKTHTKTALVVRQEKGSLRRYMHIGTGNYNPSTAGLYEDLGLFTTRIEVARDLSKLFNKLTGYVADETYEEVLVAPTHMRHQLVDRIRRQRDLGDRGHIIIKCNNMVDQDIINELYEASQAGCNVELIVRTMCAVLPGRPGLSENITVRSVIGRFLEHSRILRFGSHETGIDYLIGSADMMSRNLDKRVEAIVPVKDSANRARIQEILDILRDPHVQAWELQPSGQWAPPRPDMTKDAHELMQARTMARTDPTTNPSA